VVAVERVVIIGCAGSGKSTLARQLAGRTGLPLVERDGLGEEGSPGYLSAIAEMAARPRWLLDGAPYYADELVYAAADTVLILDYPKAWCCGGYCGEAPPSRSAGHTVGSPVAGRCH
jgi:adenylate kinase family enzyme